MQNFLNKRQWMTKNNSVNPIPTKDGRVPFKRDSFNTSSCPTTTSIKSLIPSLSTFNLPPTTATTIAATTSSPSQCTNSIADLYSPCSTTTATDLPDLGDAENDNPTTIYETPPPIFACDQHTPYPITMDQYGSPDLQQLGIQPVKLLLERLEAWQDVTKCLYNHFEALALVESSIVKSYYKLEDILAFEHHGIGGSNNQQRPLDVTGDNSNGSNSNRDMQNSNGLRESGGSRNKKKLGRPTPETAAVLSPSTLESHFAKTAGIRQVCDAWQMYHLKNAKDHIDYSSFIRAQGLPLLANIKNELKYIIRSVRSDDRLSLTHLAKLKEEAAKRLTRLDQQLTFFDRHPDHGDTKEDPWLMNTRVIKQMLKVYQQENKMHETVIRLQREIMALEKQLMEDLRQFCQQLYTLRESSWLGVDRGLLEIMRAFDNVTNDADWDTFINQCKDQLVSEEASYRHPERLQYPNHNHPLVQPLFAARMERRSSILHNWHEYIYVLTPAGFLHEYRNPKSYPSHPTSTAYIPEYNVTTLSTNRHHDLIFQLQPYALAPSFPRLTSSNTISGRCGTPSISSKPFGRATTTRTRKNITLRAKSAQDMQTWLEHMTVCSHRYRPVIQCRRSVGDLVSSVGTFSPTLVNQDMAPSPRWLLSPAPTARGFSVLADFLSFASKQLASDHQEQRDLKSTMSTAKTTELHLSEKLTPDSTSPTAPYKENQETDDRIEAAPQPPNEDPRPSILTGVQYPSD
ncbi:hypothetical protein BCR42DRAFT_476185 [Absidia repens]|uniref:PH domain-containing protein n=1 Tax=Absidia repens TaxID=90262 RepID=A0A1X2IS79_9FUNG|nr:hypothetical protein BCR42DRAFT_476185 [Absidia repens]